MSDLYFTIELKRTPKSSVDTGFYSVEIRDKDNVLLMYNTVQCDELSVEMVYFIRRYMTLLDIFSADSKPII